MLFSLKMANKTVVVLIPIYKKLPSPVEIISLTQCLEILREHPIKFLAPKKLNTDYYKEICKYFNIHFQVQIFDDYYFEDIKGYNKLMLSSFFYRIFLPYKYMLIYQLDAYVFKDELLYWCKQNYDFIGAPHKPHQNDDDEIQFLKNYAKIIRGFNKLFFSNHKIKNVGNGGFSLRKTKTFYFLLKNLKNKVENWGENNEDGFFKYWGNLLYPIFKLPKDEVAMKFSIEELPSISLKKLDNVLPFGCHAFERFEPLTWKKYINF